MSENAANRIQSAGKGFQATPTRVSSNLSPLSAFAPGYPTGGDATSSSSKRSLAHEETPTKRIKVRPPPIGLQFPHDKRESFRPLGFDITGGPIAGTSTPRKSYKLAQPPIPVKSEHESGSNPKPKRLALGGIVPDQLRVPFELSTAAESEDPLYGSDDEAERRPFHPRMSDLPSLSLQFSRLAANQKSSTMLFCANVLQDRSSRSSPSAQRGGTLTVSSKTPDVSSANFSLQILAVASYYGPNPIFTARIKTKKTAHFDQVYVVFSSDDGIRDKTDSATPASIATTLPQGETRTILANLWNPVQKLLLHEREVWLCSRFVITVGMQHSTRQ